MEKQKSKKKSQEYKEGLDLINKKLEVAKIIHKMKMEEFAFNRESDRLHHERELERGRIKSAEIRKTLYQKEAMRR